ncbi:hypothetical protein NDU88_008680 [Pleurodeles waltl]|uniref:Uncharacterized protein n=1 Tax=Pleurodeles waltl TaxID=8319 RepID=A0AAV7RVC6_PLEWA|nr:hypothetical protein NDU88_008680 [Pleurodeles waltl]
MIERRGSVSPAEPLPSLQPWEGRKVLGASAGLPVGIREIQAPCASSSSQLPRLTCLFRGRCSRTSRGSNMARLRPGPLRRERVTGKTQVLGLLAHLHGVLGCRSEAQQLIEQIAPGVACFPAVSAPPLPPQNRRDMELTL